MAEEFVNDYAAVVEQVGRRFDATDRALAIINNKLSEQEVDVYDIKAILRQHSRDISEINTRLAGLETGVNEMRDDLKQVLSLLRKQGE